MPTWFVTYKFKSAEGQWVTSNSYTVAETADKARATVEQSLKEAKVTYEIVRLRTVGDGS